MPNLSNMLREAGSLWSSSVSVILISLPLRSVGLNISSFTIIFKPTNNNFKQFRKDDEIAQSEIWSYLVPGNSGYAEGSFVPCYLRISCFSITGLYNTPKLVLTTNPIQQLSRLVQLRSFWHSDRLERQVGGSGGRVK